MSFITRRTFNQSISKGVISYLLLETLFRTESIGRNILPIARHWAIRLQEMCKDLKTESISQKVWQSQIEDLLNNIELNDVLQFIDFEKLVRGMELPDLGVKAQPIRFPRLEGLDDNVVFVKKVFGIKKDRTIIPHGHSNMASAHLVLKGEFDLKHFDKIHQEKDHLIVEPTIDRVASVGSVSSISDDKDNIHWFIAKKDQNYTFDIIMLDLNARHYDIHNLDMYAAQKLNGSQLRVPIMDVDSALKKYGRLHH